MKQQIFDDAHGLDAWETTAASRCFVHIVNSAAFHDVTGDRPPTEPPQADQYRNAGIPWFDYWNDEAKALQGSKNLAMLDSVAAMKIKKGKPVREPRVDIDQARVVRLGNRKSAVRDGNY